MSSSQLTTELPLWLRRWTVAWSWAAVAPTVVAAAVALRRLEPEFVRRAGLRADASS